MNQRFLNLDGRDYHMHTSTFSDGLNTIEEIVIHAGKIGLTEIAITDHSQKGIETINKNDGVNIWWAPIRLLSKWKNVHNDVNVIFWVEWDLLNEFWDVCFDIQWVEPDFKILSAHRSVYAWSPESITDGLIMAMKKYKDNIAFVAHPCNNSDFWNYIDIQKLVQAANELGIALEFNAKNLMHNKTNREKLDYLLKNAQKIYINSDAHTLYELQEARKFALAFLQENDYI